MPPSSLPHIVLSSAVAILLVQSLSAGCIVSGGAPPGGTGASVTSAGAGGGVAGCGLSFGEPCDACVQQSCCGQWTECGASPACVTLEACIANCTTDACNQGCSDTAGQAVVNVYNAAFACLQSSCGSACLAGSGGAGAGGAGTGGAGTGGASTTVGTGGSGGSPPLSGCAFSQCPASIDCGSPQGSNGSYNLVCEDGDPLISGQRPPVACFESFSSGPPGWLTFPQTYTCTSGAMIACNWPEGSISCPVLWNVPAQGGGTALNPGCCGFLTSSDTTPSCGIAGQGSSGLFVCGPPGPNDTPE